MAEAQTTNPGQMDINVNDLGKILSNINVGSLAPLLNNINVGSLAPLLSNINLTQLLPLIPSVFKMFGGGTSPTGAIPKGIFSGSTPYNPSTVFPAYGTQYEPFIVPAHLQGDPRFVVLGAIKPFLPQDKGLIVDQVMKFLTLFLTISSILPRTPLRAPVAPVPNSSPIINNSDNS